MIHRALTTDPTPQEVPQGTLADPSGPDPAGMPLAVRAQFDALRGSYDTVLQVARVVPMQPQHLESLADYERQLLHALARQSNDHRRIDVLHAVRVDGLKERIIADVMSTPHRRNELREVIQHDQAGREVRTFYGSKAWMNAWKAPAQVSPILIDGQPRALPCIP